MNTVGSLVKTTLEEIEKVLTTKTVVGEPIKIEGVTIIPLISVYFGFGAGGGEGKAEASQKGEGYGGGTGGGAGVKPIALIIIDKDGVRVEPIKGGVSGAIERLGETIPNMIEKSIDKMTEKWKERKQEG